MLYIFDLNAILLQLYLLNPWWYPEWSYEIESLHPSVLPSIWDFSWNWTISFFLNFVMVVETHFRLCVTEPHFLEKLSPKIEEMAQKIGFFEFKEKFGHWVLVNMFYNENLYCCAPCTNPIFGENLVPEIQTKMFSVNQIGGFF